MADAADVITDSLNIASLLAELLPSAVALYDKIVSNNQNSGLVPASTLLADVLTVANQTATTANAEIAADPSK